MKTMIYIHTHKIYINTFILTYTHKYTHINTNIHTHKYKHTHTHIYICSVYYFQVSLNSLVTHQTKILEGVVNDPDLHRLSEFNQFLLTVIDGVKNNYHGNDMILPQSNLYIPNG